VSVTTLNDKALVAMHGRDDFGDERHAHHVGADSAGSGTGGARRWARRPHEHRAERHAGSGRTLGQLDQRDE
jgi:hypothetical protein